MKTFSEFIAMGGYGDFVWSAYGIVGIVLVYLLIDACFRKKHASRS